MGPQHSAWHLTSTHHLAKTESVTLSDTQWYTEALVPNQVNMVNAQQLLDELSTTPFF